MGFLLTFFKGWAHEPVIEPVVEIREKTLEEIMVEENDLAKQHFDFITDKKNAWKRNPVSYDLWVTLGESNLRIEEELRSLLHASGHKDIDMTFHNNTNDNLLCVSLRMTYGDLYR